jgi:hypothetical protein
MGLLNGFDQAPVENMEFEYSKKTKKIMPKLAYEVWLMWDQYFLSYLLKSIALNVLAQVVRAEHVVHP